MQKLDKKIEKNYEKKHIMLTKKNLKKYITFRSKKYPRTSILKPAKPVELKSARHQAAVQWKSGPGSGGSTHQKKSAFMHFFLHKSRQNLSTKISFFFEQKWNFFAYFFEQKTAKKLKIMAHLFEQKWNFFAYFFEQKLAKKLKKIDQKLDLLNTPTRYRQQHGSGCRPHGAKK